MLYIHIANFNVCERCETSIVQKLHIFSIQIYFGTVFLRQCMCE